MHFRSIDYRKPVLLMTAAIFIALFAQFAIASTISGFVYGGGRTPLVNVDMELLNENYQVRQRTRTDGVGRYEFTNLADGLYTVRAMPFRYDFQDMEIPVKIETFNVRGSGIGNTYVIQDFNLVPKKGGITEFELGVVFAQDVPGEAKQLYKSADKAFLGDRAQDGVDDLFKAINIFPEYYEALYRMGKELYILKKYDEAWKFLLKAVDVNPKSGVAFYYLGECFHALGDDYNKNAVTSLTQASILIPAMPQVFFTLGKVERKMKRFEDAETHLLRAKKLVKQPVAEIQKELAQLYANDMKKYKEAADELELYLKASKLDKKDEKETKDLIAKLRAKAGSS